MLALILSHLCLLWKREDKLSSEREGTCFNAFANSIAPLSPMNYRSKLSSEREGTFCNACAQCYASNAIYPNQSRGRGRVSMLAQFLSHLCRQLNFKLKFREGGDVLSMLPLVPLSVMELSHLSS